MARDNANKGDNMTMDRPTFPTEYRFSDPCGGVKHVWTLCPECRTDHLDYLHLSRGSLFCDHCKKYRCMDCGTWMKCSLDGRCEPCWTKRFTQECNHCGDQYHKEDMVYHPKKLSEMASLLKKMFGRYLSTEVMNSLIENPSALELGSTKLK